MKKIIILFLLLTSCASQNLDQRIDYVKELNNSQFKEIVYQNSFAIYSLQKINNNQEVIVYIEGDGLSWIDRFTPSSDPTPTDPLAFKLAKLDQGQNIIYLARPCQYVRNKNCKKEIWTKLQYSKEIMNVYQQILDTVLQNHSKVHLVGYSGGSVIAMHLASLNEANILSVRTIAGNIDPNEFTNLLNISPYKTSINLNYLGKRITSTPQQHYYGSKDKIIPKNLHLNYQNKFISNSCIQTLEVEASHNKGWESFWKNNYNNIPTC